MKEVFQAGLWTTIAASLEIAISHEGLLTTRGRSL